MKDEIRKLFPLEFYINNKGEMVSEISLKTLNKLSDEIIKLQKDYEKADNDRHILFEQKEKAKKYINDLRDESAERQGFYNCYPDDLYIADIEELLNIFEGDK